MPYSESQKRATIKYIKSHYDDIKLRPVAGTKERWNTYAEIMGESLSEFIRNSVEKRITEIDAAIDKAREGK